MRVVNTLSAIGVFALLLSTGPAQAVVTSYITQASFLAALAMSGVDSFDDLATGVELAKPLVRSAGSFNYAATVGPSSDFFTASDGSSDIWLSTNIATDTITFSGFSGGARAIGGFFFATDIAGNPTPVSSIGLTVVDSAGSSAVGTLSAPTTASFIGFISTVALTSLAVAPTGQAGAWSTVNNLTLGTTVPVPELSTAALMIAGLTFLALSRRALPRMRRIH